jgi:serine/threonine protein kinase
MSADGEARYLGAAGVKWVGEAMSAKSGPPKAGDKFGDWALIEGIDSGGNADVWRASHPEHSNAAIKILRDLGEEPYARFRSEISALQKLGDIEGIMPMLDFSFPAGKGARPWYAVPRATSGMEFLKGADSRSLVSEFIRLGETLTNLHARRVAHRDIKPQNLLGWEGRLCFSDFGLVKYPDLTPHHQASPRRRREVHHGTGNAAGGSWRGRSSSGCVLICKDALDFSNRRPSELRRTLCGFVKRRLEEFHAG